jgi:hypothetical protein
MEGDILLKEHKMVKWINKNELKNYDFTAADWPVVRQYLRIDR